jgi:hypothetical protein
MKGGRRPGAGRPPGAKNRRTIETQTAIEASGLTPLQYMIGVMRDERNDPRVRLEAAHHAAPYVHSRLTATELTVNKPRMDKEAMVARLKILMDNNPEVLGQLGYSKVEEEQTS